MTVADYLEMLAETDHSRTADPGFYRDAAYLHGALTAGATWAQLAEATGSDEATIRQRYRKWAEGQRQLRAGKSWPGMEYAAAIKRAEGGD
jgi:hypothetical protein